MEAIEVRDLRKSFGSRAALNGLNMTVPEGAIYGFIGENGSGKSTTEKLITGLINPNGGTIRLMGKSLNDITVRSRLGVLIEQPGCFPNCTVWQNVMLQAKNLGISRPEREARRVLKLTRMEGAASNKFKNCSLGMKQRVGISIALMGDPSILILDEPVNGLDADGMRLMREILTETVSDGRHTVLISSHLLGELEKIATHYGVIRGGRMIKEMTAQELNRDCPTYTAVRAKDGLNISGLLRRQFSDVREDESGETRVYAGVGSADVAACLYENGIALTELETRKIGLEEYYMKLMSEGGAKYRG